MTFLLMLGAASSSAAKADQEQLPPGRRAGLDPARFEITTTPVGPYMPLSQTGVTTKAVPGKPVTVSLEGVSTTGEAGKIVPKISSTSSLRFATVLSEQPVLISTNARSLISAVRDQLDALATQIPNGEVELARHQEFVSFLEMLATKLNKLADTIDQAIAAGSSGSPEPILLGTAGKIANQLGLGTMEFIQKNRADLAGFSIKVALLASGYGFLHLCGVDGKILDVLTGILIGKGSNKG